MFSSHLSIPSSSSYPIASYCIIFNISDTLEASVEMKIRYCHSFMSPALVAFVVHVGVIHVAIFLSLSKRIGEIPASIMWQYIIESRRCRTVSSRLRD